jgi:hypothetical protein
LLLEFASVVDAVRCGVEVQREMAERNADVPSDRRIEFRMGINVGDIIKDGVLPHRRMFPRRQALPHQACSRCLIDPPAEPQLLF